MGDPVAAAIAFAALGANVLATGLFLLFNPGSRAVRWFSAFLTALSVWLLAAGVTAITGGEDGGWAVALAVAVMMMPVLFLASMLAYADAEPRWLPLAVTAAGGALLPLATGWMLMGTEATRWLVVGWHAVGWGGGVVVDRTAGAPARRPKEPAGVRRAVDGLLLIPPATVVVGFALGWGAFFSYVMPLIVVVIHLVLFAGVVWLRFYDIEVRAVRSGEIAAGAAEAERLAVVGELAATVAHEVRNPLTGVRSLAQRMVDDELDPERRRRYAAVIVDEMSRIDRIVEQLLALARRIPAPPTPAGPIPLEPLFQDLVLLTAARAEGASVRVEVDAGGVEALAPREALAQALLNLLLNAIRHSPAGGTVQLTAHPGDSTEIRIRDQGPGIPPADRERIFELFYSSGGGGTGLGLSVVRRLARELGWALTVDDAPEGGAEFRIRIPSPGVQGTNVPRRKVEAGESLGRVP